MFLQTNISTRTRLENCIQYARKTSMHNQQLTYVTVIKMDWRATVIV